MHLNAIAAFLPAILVASGILAQSPAAEPPESGSPTTGTPAVTFTSEAFVFCSAPDCTGACELVEASTVPRDDTHPAPNDMGFQSMYWYNPSGSDILLYTCLNDCLVINPVEITESDTCYNLYNNSVSTDFYTYYYIS